MDLHPDSIEMESAEIQRCGGQRTNAYQKVAFEPFVGVGPRRYFDLFSMRLSSGHPVTRKTADGKFKDWNFTEARPRVPMLRRSYLQLEQLAIGEIEDTMKRLEGKSNANA
jgi:hypothetical protein